MDGISYLLLLTLLKPMVDIICYGLVQFYLGMVLIDGID